MKILMVLTSHDQLGDTGHKTGFWLDEFVSPYYVFADAGAELTLASPKGGQPPLDPRSDDPQFQTPATDRFKNDAEAQKRLAETYPLSSISVDAFDAVFYPGGHGPLWDLAGDASSIAVIEAMARQGKPIAAVCHGPAALRAAKSPEGRSILKGRKATGFSNSEEEAAGLTGIVPFLIEDTIRQLGGEYAKGNDWESFVVEDGQLITGQNPASSEATAAALVRRLQGASGA
ncbi:MAG: type 1 glutamine amidotransferase domain-containing protein [Nevskiales bacterium]|nr:type 1 glutamine amidotransferase domain-containing protein [Nevskiales bacterium]